MEGVPRGLSVEQVATCIRGIEGVADVHHLNIWTVCSHILALSAHVEIEPEQDVNREALLHRIEHQLAHQFHITHTTIQLDCSSCSGGPLIKELNHVERRAISCGHGHEHS
jgi:cobalt-zinc-cadmium efflux system protein